MLSKEPKLIVIPMAGLSSRFAADGYTLPKYMLNAFGRPLFDHAVLSFERYFEQIPFLFIARDVSATSAFLDQRCRELGISQYQTIMLDKPTRGQAETVAFGIDAAGLADTDPLTIFNIDTFRFDFRFPEFAGHIDGFLETFEGSGSNWSFVRPVSPNSDRVAQTSEKRRISKFCCTGLYHFSNAADFRSVYACHAALDAGQLEAGELYVAPLYNALIADGRDIRFSVVAPEAVVFCGVPSEYRAVLEGPPIR